MYQLRFILLGCFFLCAFTGQAQWKKEGVRVSLGKELKRSHQKGLQQMVGYDGNGLYTLQKRMTPFYHFGSKQAYTYLLQHYNADMNLVQANKLFPEKGGNPLSFEFMVQLQEAIYLFSSGYDEGREKKTLFAQKIDKQSLEQVGACVQVAELDKEELGGHFSWKLSEDQSKLLLMYTYYIGSRQTYDLRVFDQHLAKQWSKRDCVPHGGDPFAVEQYEVDEKGNVYLLSTSFSEKRREKRAGAPDYAYHLTTYKLGGTAEDRYGISLPGKFLTDIRIKINNEKDIVGGGFYAEEGTYNLKGSYFFTIDGNSSRVVAKSVNPFEPDFLEKVAERTALPKNGKEEAGQLRQFGLRLNDILLREDGSTVLLGEQFSLVAQSSMKKNFFGRTRTRSSYEYNFNNIVVVSLDRSGKEEWTRQISKQQHSVNDGGLYSSYRMKMVEGKLYAVFNSQPQVPSAATKSNDLLASGAVLVRVSRDGHQKIRVLPELNSHELRLVPQVGINIGKGEMILLGAGTKKNRFIKLRINEDALFTRAE